MRKKERKLKTEIEPATTGDKNASVAGKAGSL